MDNFRQRVYSLSFACTELKYACTQVPLRAYYLSLRGAQQELQAMYDTVATARSEGSQVAYDELKRRLDRGDLGKLRQNAIGESSSNNNNHDNSNDNNNNYSDHALCL